MEDKELAILKTKAENAYDKESESIDNFKKVVMNHPDINLPSGFELDVTLESRSRLSGIDYDDIRIHIEDKNRKEGESKAKYFWTMDGKATIAFREGILDDYQSSSLQGGTNSRPYENKTLPAFDPIEINELVLNVNTAYLNILKVAKATPDFFLKPFNVFKEAQTEKNALASEYRKEIKTRKDEKQVKDLVLIEDGFDKLGSKRIEKLINTLKHTDQKEVSVSVVGLFPPTNGHQELEVKKIQVTCKHGAKTSYYLKEGNFVGSVIKASDVAGHLAKGIVLDGKRPESIEDFKEMFPMDFEVKSNNQRARTANNQLVISIDEVAKVAKKLIESSPEVQKNKGSRQSLK